MPQDSQIYSSWGGTCISAGDTASPCPFSILTSAPRTSRLRTVCRDKPRCSAIALAGSPVARWQASSVQYPVSGRMAALWGRRSLRQRSRGAMLGPDAWLGSWPRLGGIRSACSRESWNSRSHAAGRSVAHGDSPHGLTPSGRSAPPPRVRLLSATYMLGEARLTTWPRQEKKSPAQLTSASLCLAACSAGARQLAGPICPCHPL